MKGVIKSYSYAYNKYKVDANVVGQELERIEAEEGYVSKENFLDASRPEEAPTHEIFEWNDAVAAEKYRLHQSGEVIRVLRVTVEETEPEEVKLTCVQADENKAVLNARAYVNTERNNNHDKGKFSNIQSALEDKDKRRIVLENALYEYKRMKEKYDYLEELSIIGKAIEQAEEVLKGETD